MVLCKDLGYSTQEELLKGMSAKQLTKWVAFYNLQDEDYKKKLEAEANREAAKDKTNEQLADEMVLMLRGIGTNIDG